MDLDKDTFHVVIRLPYKRPPGFVEPPSIVWTNEMEHKLWQYMSQKNTDWNEIAEQLGVPTSYIVRHAAFIYETQLRGIHQQLRLNTTANSISRNSPTPRPSRPVSTRYSNQQEERSPMIDSNVSFRTIPERSKETLKSSGSTATARNFMSQEQEEPVAEEEEKQDEEVFSSHFERMKLQVEEPAFLPHKHHPTDLSNSRQQLSISIQNLKKLDSSFSNSSAPPSPATAQPSTASGSNHESVIHSIGSSFSDLSDSSVTQSALEEAFLSKFNQGGSKMSLLNFSRKYYKE
ncbi:uncharacterized protein B0P05DRAFT_542894 [Gilbertella persicaria]|uniref:uncharacterized protein n=1 Tax=Gilbertella persicaria TaxID=101096 RepID=UPI00221E770D|nr:uncharacterized protein B0P05DRAFT_542894 [Gilbertella persicaria]KAI8078195.1 hypothetical protein B0P05DRAFT_542894 [Gilbertella persicaria]